MSILYYVCECGCVNTKEQLVRVRPAIRIKNSDTPKIEICNECENGGRVLYRRTECIQCLQYFDTDQAAGKVSERCAKCKELRAKELKNNAVIRYRTKRRELSKQKKESMQLPRTFCSEICGEHCMKLEAPWEVFCGREPKL